VIAAAPREADEAQTRHREQGDRRRLGYRRGTDGGRSREDLTMRAGLALLEAVELTQMDRRAGRSEPRRRT